MVLIATSAFSSPTNEHLYRDIAETCRPNDATFETVLAQLTARGWVKVSPNEIDDAIAVIGDGLIQSSRVATTGDQLRYQRLKESISIGSWIKRKESEYFKSATLRKEALGQTYVNVFWRDQAKVLICSAASEHMAKVNEMVADQVIGVDASQIDGSGEEFFRVSQFKRSDLSRSTMFLLDTNALNEYLEEPLKAQSSLKIVGLR